MQQLRIEPNGDMVFIYNDSMANFLDEGDAKIHRASHVEPAPGGWTADLAPVGGPILGPFKLRQSALDAESEWLKVNFIQRG